VQKNVLLNGVDSSTENAGSFHAIFQKKISCTIRGEEEKLSTYLAKKFQIREDLALHLRVVLWSRRCNAGLIAVWFDALMAPKATRFFS
jgi:hypothetical protein